PSADRGHAEQSPVFILAAPELGAVCVPPVRSARDYLADSAAVTASGAGQHTAGRLCHPAGLLAGGARCAAATPAPPLVDSAARLALARRRPATGRGQLNRSIEFHLDTECYVPGTSSTSSMSEASYNIALPSNPLDELVLVPARGATRWFRPARATVTAFSTPMRAPHPLTLPGALAAMSRLPPPGGQHQYCHGERHDHRHRQRPAFLYRQGPGPF